LPIYCERSREIVCDRWLLFTTRGFLKSKFIKGGNMKMGKVILKSEQLNLPEEIAIKLRGKEVELIETKEGILLKPVEDSVRMARGVLKGSNFSSKRYMQLKREEKELER
jgi:hypothetical protein